MLTLKFKTDNSQLTVVPNYSDKAKIKWACRPCLAQSQLCKQSKVLSARKGDGRSSGNPHALWLKVIIPNPVRVCVSMHNWSILMKAKRASGASQIKG